MTKIEWTDVTWNPIRGCTHASPGCLNCYAEKIAERFSGPGLAFEGYATPRGWTGKLGLIAEKLDEPLRWRKPRPRRVFVNSMSDLFHESLPDEAIDQVFAVMALAPQHTFQVLTKRAGRMREWFARTSSGASRESLVAESMHYPDWLPAGRVFLRYPAAWPLPNVWLGVSAEDQQRADERIPELLQTPAAVRFVSAEPLLGPIDLRDDRALTFCNFTGALVRGECEHGLACRPRTYLGGLDWVIVGGESGPGARPCDVAWIRSIVQQCREAGVACFVKQFGARPTTDHRTRPPGEESYWTKLLKDSKGGDPSEWPEDLRVREFPHA